MWLCLAILAGVSGCGGASDGPPVVTVYEVKGKVLLKDGTPLSGGHVYFVPVNGTMAPEAEIGSDGSFELVTGRSGPGAPPGDYKVRIEPKDPTLMASSKRAGKAKLPFATKYLDEDSSELRVTVRAQANQLEPLRLN
jgi:hypothetical protein